MGDAQAAKIRDALYDILVSSCPAAIPWRKGNNGARKGQQGAQNESLQDTGRPSAQRPTKGDRVLVLATGKYAVIAEDDQSHYPYYIDGNWLREADVKIQKWGPNSQKW